MKKGKHKKKKKNKNVKCKICGWKHLIKESDVEGYWCPNCGGSDQDE